MTEQEPELSREELLQRYGRQSPRGSASTRRSPFKFLDSYELDDADIFFGRDTEIEELLGHFRSYGHVLIYGESGSGKSSLVQCGLRSQIPEADALFIPLRVHTTALPAVCHQIGESASHQLGEAVEFSPDARLVETLRTAHQAASRPIVLFFDQFEELFIFHDSKIRRRFAEELASIQTARLNVKVIIGVRQDFLGHLSELEDTVEGLFDNRFWLRRMSRENAAQAVVQACATCDVTIEDNLAQVILHRLDPGGQGVELPYLQVAMDRLYRQAVEANPGHPVISAGAVEELGDITDILGTFLVEEVAKLPSPDSGRQILKGFVTHEGTRRTLDRVAVAQEAAGFGDTIPQDVLEAHLNQLASVRILREIADTDSYELRHDALAATVAGWISEVEKELIEVRDNLVNRFREYEARDQDTGALLDQGFLNYLAVYRERLRPLLDEATLQYVKDSERHVGHAARVRRRVRQVIAGVVGSIILCCLVVALWQRNAATQREQETKRQLDLNRIQEGLLWVERADRFLDQLPNPPDRFAAALMAARAIGFEGYGRANADQEFKGDYIDFLKGEPAGKHRSRAQAILKDSVILPIWQSPLFRHHDGPIEFVTFCPDGETLASGSSGDGIFKFWNSSPKSGDESGTIGVPSMNVSSVAIRSDGKLVASGTSDGALNIWNVDTRTEKILRAGGSGEAVRSLAFSPDGETVASGSANGNIKIWEVSTGSEIGFLDGGETKFESVVSLAFSPDGERLAAGSEVGGLTLWNAEESKSIVSEPAAHNGPVYSLAFDPTGRILASGGEDGALRIWEAKTGVAKSALSGHAAAVRCVDFARDGKILASGSSDGTIKLWDPGTGDLIETIRGRQAGVRSVSFSRDGKTLASGGATGLLQLWEVASGKEISPSPGAQGSVTSVAISRNGEIFASGGKNGTLKLWDAASGKELRLLGGHEDAISSLSFSHDSQTIASTGADGTIKYWNVADGEENPSSPLPTEAFSSAAESEKFLNSGAGDDNFDSSVALSPDGTSRAAGSGDGTIKILNLRVAELGQILTDIAGNPIGFFSGHRAAVHSLAFSSDSKILISGSEDGTVKLWAVHTGLEEYSLDGDHEKKIESAASGPDGFFASGALDGTIKLWNPGTGAEIDLWNDSAPVNGVAFSPVGKPLAWASDDRTIKFWDWEQETGEPVQSLLDCPEPALCLTFSADGKILASGHEKDEKGHGFVRLWNVETGREIGSVAAHEGSVKGVAFQPGSNGMQILASGGNDRLVKLWGLQSADEGSIELQLPKDERGVEIGNLSGHGADVWSVSFSPDGETIASGSKDRSIKLWNVRTGSETDTLSGHQSPVKSLTFSPDGKLLASGSQGGNLRLWDVATGETIHSHDGHSAMIVGVGFSSDGKTLQSAGNYAIKIWDVEFLISNQRPDLAVYLSKSWLELDGADIRWKTTTGNLFAPSKVFEYENVPRFSQLGALLKESANAPAK